MIVIDKDQNVCFDVDDTLLIYDFPNGFKDTITIEHGVKNVQTSFVVNTPAVDLLKSYYNNNKTIIVWSAGGFDWVEKVIKALNLEDFVDICMTKPEKYIDDLDANEWMYRVKLPIRKGFKLRSTGIVYDYFKDIK